LFAGLAFEDHLQPNALNSFILFLSEGFEGDKNGERKNKILSQLNALKVAKHLGRSNRPRRFGPPPPPTAATASQHAMACAAPIARVDADA